VLENSKRISKNKIVKLPPAFSTPSPDAVQGDEDSYINYERLMNNDPRTPCMTLTN